MYDKRLTKSARKQIKTARKWAKNENTKESQKWLVEVKQSRSSDEK